MKASWVSVLVSIWLLSALASATTSDHGTIHFVNTSDHAQEYSHVNDSAGHPENESGHHDMNHTSGHGLHVAALNFHEVQGPFVLIVVVLVATLSKLGFHHADFISSLVPESCILIILGTIIATILHFAGFREELQQYFTPHVFFIFLLPPIILEAAFSLHDRVFLENLGSILLFAVIGTVLACFLIGGSLYGLALSGAMGPIQLTFVQILLFSSLIVAVDPVAVLAVFQEIHVNEVLYFLVFGESLLNDGVTIVLYKVMLAYNSMPEITALHMFLGIVKFFVVSVCGLLIGIVIGLISSIVTKYTKKVKVVEPVTIYGFAYLAFLLAEMFELSGIISIIGCGLIQMQYAMTNVTQKSRTTIKYFTKVFSNASEIVIFLMLGLFLVTPSYYKYWHTGFALWTLLLCTVYRFMITFGLSFLINKFDSTRVRKIGIDEMFLISYGGLRGAVCFSLVAMLDENLLSVEIKSIFVTTSLTVILFTVFVQGTTIKYLVKLMRTRLAPAKDVNLCEELTENVVDHLMAGVENIVGFKGKYAFKAWLEYYDDHYLKPFLQRDPEGVDEEIKQIYEKLTMKEHLENLQTCNAKTLPEICIRPQMKRMLTDRQVSIVLEKSDDTAVVDAIADIDYRPRNIRSPRSPTKKSFSVNIQNPTAGDLRKMMVINPSQMLFLSKYDKNITQEDSNSVSMHLMDKRRRTLRLKSHCQDRTQDRVLSWSEDQSNEAMMRQDTDAARHKRAPAITVAFANDDNMDGIPQTVTMETLVEDDQPTETTRFIPKSQSEDTKSGRCPDDRRPPRLGQMDRSASNDIELVRQDAVDEVEMSNLNQDKQ